MIDEETLQKMTAIVTASAPTGSALTHLIDAQINERLSLIQRRNAEMRVFAKTGITLVDFNQAYRDGYNDTVHFTATFFTAALAITLHAIGYSTDQALNTLKQLKSRIPTPDVPSVKRDWFNRMRDKGITKKDLERARKLGEADARKDAGFDVLFARLDMTEEINEQIQAVMDEEICVADIVNRCKNETDIDVEMLLRESFP